MSAALAPAAAEHPEQWLYQLSTMVEVAATVEAAGRLGVLDHLRETPPPLGRLPSIAKRRRR